MYTDTPRQPPRDITSLVLLRRNAELAAERDTLKRLWQMGLKEIAVLRHKLGENRG